MVLDHPLMDINLLPIIGDEELETPIYIPNRTMSSTLAAANQQQKPDATKQNVNPEFMVLIKIFRHRCARTSTEVLIQCQK